MIQLIGRKKFSASPHDTSKAIRMATISFRLIQLILAVVLSVALLTIVADAGLYAQSSTPGKPGLPVLVGGTQQSLLVK